jgi:radical SAM superfamily enzyme YgiQ (UPF0313 family)
VGEGGMKQADLVFLYHPHTYDIDPGAQVGLGLLLLATYAKELGANVRVINAQSMAIAETCGIIPKCRVLLMYGCLIDKPLIEAIARNVRCQADLIVVGGPIAITPEIDNVDWVIKGFGEDFIETLVSGKSGKWDCEHLRYSIDRYPFPDRTLIEGGYGGNIFTNGSKGCKVSTTLLTSRGCRYNCAFCTSGSEKFFEQYSIERIEKELEHCLSLGLGDIRISDDNLMNNRGRLNELCNLFKEAKIRWRGSIRVVPSSVEMYQMMKESGCEELSFGIESGDQEVLNLMNKGIKVENNVKAIRNAKEAGVLTRALMMMGTPGETRDTLYANMSWVELAEPDMVSLKMFVPYPGTEIYYDPEKYKCKIHLPLVEVNNSAYRPDRSEPKSNIDSDTDGDGLFQEELTYQFEKMKSYLETKGIENRG